MSPRRDFVRFALAVFLVGAATPFIGCGGSGGGSSTPPTLPSIGIVHSTNAANVEDVKAKLSATGFFASVTDVDASASTPLLTDLTAFDAILVMADDPFLSPTLLGDRVADAVDAGTGVVVSLFAIQSNRRLGGRFLSDDYYALVDAAGPMSGPPYHGWQTSTPGHPLLTGVTLFGGGVSSFRTRALEHAGATVVASWLGFDFPLIVERTLPNGHVRIDLNFFPPTSDARADFINANGHGPRMVANALLRVSGRL